VLSRDRFPEERHVNRVIQILDRLYKKNLIGLQVREEPTDPEGKTFRQVWSAA
jgi:hypothetical protein